MLQGHPQPSFWESEKLGIPQSHRLPVATLMGPNFTAYVTCSYNCWLASACIDTNWPSIECCSSAKCCSTCWCSSACCRCWAATMAIQASRDESPVPALSTKCHPWRSTSYIYGKYGPKPSPGPKSCSKSYFDCSC